MFIRDFCNAGRGPENSQFFSKLVYNVRKSIKTPFLFILSRRQQILVMAKSNKTTAAKNMAATKKNMKIKKPAKNNTAKAKILKTKKSAKAKMNSKAKNSTNSNKNLKAKNSTKGKKNFKAKNSSKSNENVKAKVSPNGKIIVRTRLSKLVAIARMKNLANANRRSSKK